jgi:glucose/arabinose dehydrogenase
MYNLTDNKKGAVYILEGFDLESKSFAKVIPYLTGLRNPNSVAFFRDDAGTDWLYLALTDRLVRYKYSAGDNSPTTVPEVLATFPDYGLNYKYGGWHLTRTIAIGNNGKIYVSVGSSCNACEETEKVRASVFEMDPDGRNQRTYVTGLRNAVGLKWIAGALWATDMGADHLGVAKPADTMYKLTNDTNYGWPYCYQSGPKVFSDPAFNTGSKKLNCLEVPRAHTAFEAHSSPLGFQFFDAASDDLLAGHFLVALHGSTRKSLERGYRVSRVPGIDSTSDTPEDFITGFIKAGKVFGRPADIMSFGKDAFLLTDDNAGVVYYVYKSEKGSNK